MLSYISDDHTLLGQTAEKLVEKANRRLGQTARIKLGKLGTARDVAPLTPIRQGGTANFRMKFRNRIRQIANHRNIAGTNPIKLRRINFKVNNLGAGREPCRIASNPIIQPRSENQQQISFVQRRICRPRPMHPNHAEIVGRLRRDRTQPVHSRKCRDIQIIKQAPQLGNRP